MKHQHSIIFSHIIRWTLSIVLGVGAVACHNQKGAEQNDIHAAIAKGDAGALRELIRTGTDVNAKEPFGGSTPLMMAAVFNRKEMVPILIDAGADLNAQNKEGSTALISAAFLGRPEIVKLLLDAGADKTIKNQYGSTAYESVATPFDQVKSSYDMIGKLLEPMGLKLDYVYLEKIRPEIAGILK